jgi:AcrR family transcriptional regulator
MATPSADIAPPPTTRASSQSTGELDHAVAERHQRADARRNREKILAAAEIAFRELGTAVQMEDIARRAEVGVGTLYRHFPTKEHLVAELATHRFSGCISEAEMALAAADVWAAMECFVYRNAEEMATDAGLRDTFMAACQSGGIWAVERDRLNQRLAALLERAQTDGSVRQDVTLGDVQALMCGLSAAIAGGGDWRRLASVMLAGLHAPQPTPTAR